ncbi:epoxide hydrolase 2 [Hyaloscypha variabilis F]|uniref:Epoxide hydrolase 2 n=1 Tax=Hyaloscypha variabilis (strain UAMH 11265 / GT02V1 / F) TaxID=1149755 RepID=A0A2J6R2U6_HYAVF|nr:epoxide hydrolase 2 [Hyaloscypha variabilis F]
MAEPFPPLPLPAGITESYLPSHDLTYHILSAGQRGKPLILCLHGFPELAFSWRKIMPAIAAEGYYVVAYDQRGYGRTTGWDTRDFSSVDLSTFTFTKLVRDAVILVNALGYKQVDCVIGHDFGAVGASMCALMRPDIFKSVVIMSHPFKGSPSLPFDIISNPKPAPEKEDVHKALAELPEPRKHYKWYYSTSPAAAEMDNPQPDLDDFLRGYFHLKSADWKGNDPKPLKAWQATELAKLPYYYVMPLEATMRQAVKISMEGEDPTTVSRLSARWLTDDDLVVYAQEFGRNGFQGGLNWYRIATDPNNMKDVELFAGKKIEVPTLFISGKKDWGTYQEPGAVEKMGEVCSQFKGSVLVDNAGHWVQQEQPEKVIQLVSKFLRDTKVDSISH